jgi:putative sterol carrier protein
MSDVITAAVDALNEKDASDFSGTAKFVIEGEGSIVMDSTGARAEDSEADVTLSADAETFQAILSGDLNATAAFMGGKLTVDGDMGLAMALGNVLA